ncbi:tryptophan synthase subunit alpha [bacterium]|nr:tryptophan synthase subunit alpha [bacterium]MCI0604674.1 tryptophan synthase subunit alpha [bacterium]
MKFFPYLLADYPDRLRFAEILDLTVQYADTIEIGIPFTDPVADGPVIATASSKVLATGFSLDSLFQLLHDEKSSVPLALMSYANPILAYGRADFLQACTDCGAKYLIVPDVPFEESEEWRGVTKEHGLAWISFVSLLTGEERLRRITQTAEGFLYLLSLKGITGASIHSPEQVRDKALKIRKQTNVPVALGFGIKNVKDIDPYREAIDAVIVGSKIIELIDSNDVEELRQFYESFRSA